MPARDYETKALSTVRGHRYNRSTRARGNIVQKKMHDWDKPKI